MMTGDYLDWCRYMDHDWYHASIVWAVGDAA